MLRFSATLNVLRDQRAFKVTLMSDIKTQSIMHGLPHFIEHDSAGFDRLKSRLGLNRRTCRSLLDSTPAKQYIRLSRKELLRKEKTSGDRDKALLFKLYGNPNFRRVVWTAVYDRPDSTRRRPRIIEDTTVPRVWRSLVLLRLRRGRK